MKLAKKLHLEWLLSKDKKGVALVTVLTVMSLTTILVMTFFSLATSEHRASDIYANGLQAQQVGEEAVNLVIAQIREATSVGTTVAWASQPGAIRQWDDSGRPKFAYKLYSDEKMKVQGQADGWSDFQEDFRDMANWSNKPDHYVDLNEPVIRGSKVYYPIVHPAASSIPQWPKPQGRDQDGVEGFSYNDREGRKLQDQGQIGPKAARVAGSRDGHVAMPVRWIYQLADGTMGVLSDSASGQGYSFQRISGSGTPGVNNRIVARFAFWTDDETTKLNINTHAGGLAWDVPKAGGALDMAMARFQPAQHEWQRYPGHPASTHLIPALAPGVIDIVNDRDAMEMLFRLVPRVVGGGSESGTRLINTNNPKEENGLIADRDPLFPTLDDVIMKANRETNKFPDAQGRPLPEQDLAEYLERSKFFVTANSRAPETNIFNLPRIAIWPIYNADYTSSEYKTHLSPFDRLLHFCASMGASDGQSSTYPRYEYVFKRQDADSTTYDYEKIPRNKELYQYLLKMLQSKVPGFGASFQSKYTGDEYQQILTEIFDYIRTTNLHDDSMYEDFKDAFTKVNTNKARTYTNPRDANNTQIGHKGHGQVVPIRIGNTKGFGRFYTLGSVQVQVISCAEGHYVPIPKNFGATAYRSSDQRQISQAYSPGQGLYVNFPPHPPLIEKPVDPRNMTVSEEKVRDMLWPPWLRAIYDAAYPAPPPPPAPPIMGDERAIVLFDAAFDPDQWNWQLAFLDEVYAVNVKSSPSGAKFNRASLGPAFDSAGNPIPGNAFTMEKTHLDKDEQLVQAGLFFSLFTPSIGWGSINPDMEIEIKNLGGMKFTGAEGPGVLHPGEFLGFTDVAQYKPDTWLFATNRVDTCWGGRRYGGLMPMEYLVSSTAGFSTQIAKKVGFPTGVISSIQGGYSRVSPLDRGWDKISGINVNSTDPSSLNGDTQWAYRYDLVTAPFKIKGAEWDESYTGNKRSFIGGMIPGDVNFGGGNLRFRFYHGGRHSEFSTPNGSIGSKGAAGGELVQEIEVDVPPFPEVPGSTKIGYYGHAPLMYNDLLDERTYRSHLGGYYNEFYSLEKDSVSILERNSLGADPGNIINYANGSASDRTKNKRVSSNENKPSMNIAMLSGRFGQVSINHRPGLFSPNDIVQSIEIASGDARVVAAHPSIKISNRYFEIHRNYGSSAMAHSTTSAVGSPYYGALTENDWKDYIILPGLSGIRGVSGGNEPYGQTRVPLPFGSERSSKVQLYGDFDNGSGLMIDGPYINKPDEGNTHSLKAKYMQDIVNVWERLRNTGEFPYFNRDDKQESGGPAYFSPNRLVSGPGMFGSLPTGVLSNKPWQTLLFRPEIKNGTKAGFQRHPGGKNPPDHLIMDLFWMPVVEPYAISEPLSTAGKVNINFDIVPFLHVQRNTSLRGVFRSEMMLCIPNKWHTEYKHNYGRGIGWHWRDKPTAGTLYTKRLRSVIRDDDTLDQFFDHFNDGKEIFKSATEICDIHLIPEEVSTRLGQSRGSIDSYTPTVQQMDSGQYWSDHSLVGDNSRERAYTNIQTRLTSKSNTYLVHYRAQVLKQARRDNPAEYGQWRPETDTVQAEYRGSSMVERYVNPNADDIPDLAKEYTAGTSEGLDPYYRYRIVNPRRFAP